MAPCPPIRRDASTARLGPTVLQQALRPLPTQYKFGFLRRNPNLILSGYQLDRQRISFGATESAIAFLRSRMMAYSPPPRVGKLYAKYPYSLPKKGRTTDSDWPSIDSRAKRAARRLQLQGGDRSSLPARSRSVTRAQRESIPHPRRAPPTSIRHCAACLRTLRIKKAAGRQSPDCR